MSIFKRTKKIDKLEENKVIKTQKDESGKSFILNKKNRNITTHHLIVKPILTEKASSMEAQSKYIFMVENKANKVEIKKAIESLYGVHPIKVNIINVSGKKVRSAKGYGVTKNWRKAVVTLKSGEKIEYAKTKI